MTKERKKKDKNKLIIQFTSEQYPQEAHLVSELSAAEDRSLGQTAVLLIREANHYRVHGCTCGTVPKRGRAMQSV
jgi:hypothetical protein